MVKTAAGEDLVKTMLFLMNSSEMNVSYSEIASHKSSSLNLFPFFFISIFSKNKTIVNCKVAIQVKVHLQCSAVKLNG